MYDLSRDLKIYDGDVDENLPQNLTLPEYNYVFRDYFISFTSYNVGEVS